MSDETWKKKILFIGNGEEDCRLILKACQYAGHELHHAPDHEKALKDFQPREDGIDLIILDIDMPGIDGVGTLKRIRSSFPGLPVLILTEFYKKQLECEFFGIEAFIHRPYSPDTFIRRILSVLERNNSKKKQMRTASAGHPAAKILVANEKKEVCELLCVVLTEDVLNAHFEVVWACSGEEALRVSREFKPDIGILDVKISDMWGHELIDHFKSGKGHAPRDFIIYSSFAEPKHVDTISKLGYPVFLDLTQLEILVACLKKMCAQHRLIREA